MLDEATAELGKMEFSPMLATIEIDFKITKAVPLHSTLRIDCEVRCRGTLQGVLQCRLPGRAAGLLYPQHESSACMQLAASRMMES